MSPKKIEKNNQCRDVKRKNRTDLASKPINWIWSCALRSVLLPHSFEHRSRKPLERSVLGIRWKSQGCIYLCSADAMTWAPESERKIFHCNPFSRNHFVENHDFSLQPVFHHKMVTQMHFVATHIGFWSTIKTPKAFCSKGGWPRFKQLFVVWGCVCKRFSWHNYPAECTGIARPSTSSWCLGATSQTYSSCRTLDDHQCALASSL